MTCSSSWLTRLGVRAAEAAALPLAVVLPEILSRLDETARLVLEAPPGAGKTSLLPLALLDAAWLAGRRIVLLEPRRVAARAAARRMARLLGEEVGQSVGYRVRLDSRESAATRILAMTGGVFTRMLQDDPGLEDIGCVIFDEFHERGLESDLGLALCLESQGALREDLRLVVMSATLDGADLGTLLEPCAQLRAEGRSWPVRTVHLPPPAWSGQLDDPALLRHVARVTREALATQAGSVLVFLPGARELHRVRALLEEGLPADVRLHLLYGEQPAEAQDAALAPPCPPERKVVLATAIAESSLTLEGVDVVVDSGLARRLRHDPGTGMSRLVTERISRAGADQRRGRAGRLGPGLCYRLWSEAEDAGLRPASRPEILEADLADFCLELAAWGTGADALRWLDSPPVAALDEARRLLVALGALIPVGADGRDLPETPGMLGVTGIRATGRSGRPGAAGDVAIDVSADGGDGAGDASGDGAGDDAHTGSDPVSVDADDDAVAGDALAPSADSAKGRPVRWRITPRGQAMLRLPLHPRLAHMLLEAPALGLGEVAPCLAALAQERDPLAGRDAGADIRSRLALLEPRRGRPATQAVIGAQTTAGTGARAVLRGSAAKSAGFSPDETAASRGTPGRLRAQADQIRRLAAPFAKAAPLPWSEAVDEAGKLLALAYPERVAQRREGRSYLLASGQGARLAEGDPLTGEEWLAVGAVDGQRDWARIHQAAPLGREAVDALLGARVACVRQVSWDRREEAVLAREEWRWGALVLRSRRLEPGEAEERVRAAVLEGIRSLGPSCLPWTEGLRQWRARVCFVRALTANDGAASGAHDGPEADKSWPDCSDAGLMRTLQHWLEPFVTGVTRRAHFAALPLDKALHSLLSWEQGRHLEELAPASLRVPSGSEISLDYSANLRGADEGSAMQVSAPVLAVKLQEVFGLVSTPQVGGGRVPVTIHLLSPAGRPLQVTSDLAGFWRSGYAAVRAEMRGRYPKHPWPEDPLQALPTRLTSRALAARSR